MAVRGATLVELLVTLAVAGVLLLFALPRFGGLLDSQRSTAAVNQLIGALSYARSAALLHRQTVTLCPSAGAQCLGRNEWHHGALIFLDHNRNGILDAEDQALTRLPALHPGARIYWRSFRNRSYLQFQPRGYTAWQNGSFLYCPPDAAPQRARMVILNQQGRTRLARDRDGDGIDEDAEGRPLACPAA